MLQMTWMCWRLDDSKRDRRRWRKPVLLALENNSDRHRARSSFTLMKEAARYTPAIVSERMQRPGLGRTPRQG